MSLKCIAQPSKMLPALSRAKLRSKVVNCTSNYRQWALAVNMYGNVNLLYGDGHVETHKASQVRLRYVGVYGYDNFY
jgi:prepilin-type processing-associated H-X9-DG protein